MSKNLDLYYVHLFNDFSGSPRVLRDAIDCELNDSDNTYVFTSKHKGFLDNANAHRINCFYARSKNRYIQLIYFLFSQLNVFFKLLGFLFIGFIKGRKSTVVVNTMLPFGAGLASKIMRTKLIYYVHETDIQPNILKLFLRFFIEHCATHVIFVSKYLQSVETFIKPSQSVIYNGLRSDFPNIEKIDKYPKFLGKQLFFAGSLKSYKGLEQLILITESLPEFKFIAAINCEDEELKEFMANRHLPENITFIARPINIKSYFEKSFAVFNLSLPDEWVETFGLSLIEGMAFGSPVIAPPVGGPVEFVTHENGLLVDSRQTKIIVDFIHYLNSSFDVWSSFSEQAFISSQQFTSAAYKKSVINYFTENRIV